MSPLQIPATQPGVPRLGSTLLHFLWQGVAIAVIYAVARKRAETSSPNVRYLLGCVSLAAMAVAPLVTWWMLGSSEERFQLEFHREMREMSVFNLVVAKGDG